ncbi:MULTISPECIES: hypothetical protein [unclassified Bacillus (in: firmicutes)]|uniref:hypothetical protein n=1 Tax=unclassified Bacillus (in: firmicutes) TaxID=185979 RepID=UPI001BE66DDD|nr:MULTISPECIES: hypothetical protein [unclassified Bacillus (in: firmicutes)]MBT2618461.1 hypothetical protein [Bacillus sp. ISL-78]MBT2630674.1 hypothetical protein [Bacillus sp. ISL-101]MBT2718750.1 hypothetical protein [Bacillus sp. ISL-57]
MTEKKIKCFIKGLGLILLVSYVSQGGVTLGMPEDFIQNTLTMVSDVVRDHYAFVGLRLLDKRDKKPPNKPTRCVGIPLEGGE